MICLFHVFLLKVRLARESLLKKSKNVTKKCMLKKSERCINFFVCRHWYMKIAFLVCVAASHLPFSLFLCSRYRVFGSKRCVAARCMVFSHYSCMRYMLFCQRWCIAASHLCFSASVSYDTWFCGRNGVSVKVCRWWCEGAKDKVQMADSEWCRTKGGEWWMMNDEGVYWVVWVGLKEGVGDLGLG